MAACKNQLETLMINYIETSKPASKDLMRELQLTPVADRYELVKRVRGKKYIDDTVILVASWIHDLDGLKSMVDGFSSDQMCTVMRPKNRHGSPALSCAILKKRSYDTSYKSIEMVEYMWCNLSTEHKFKILRLQDFHGDTALHCALEFKDLHLLQCLLEPFTWKQQEELLKIKNKNGELPEDICLPVEVSRIGTKLEVIRFNYVNRTGILESRLESNLKERMEREEAESKTILRLADLEEQIKAIQREKDFVSDERDTAKIKCNHLENELIAIKQDMRRRDRQLQTLIDSNATLISVCENATHIRKSQFSEKDQSSLKEYLGLRNQQKKASTDHEYTLEQMRTANAELARCEDKLYRLAQKAVDTSKEQESLQRRKEKLRKEIELLEKKSADTKDKLKRFEKRIKEIECSSSNETSTEDDLMSRLPSDDVAHGQTTPTITFLAQLEEAADNELIEEELIEEVEIGEADDAVVEKCEQLNIANDYNTSNQIAHPEMSLGDKLNFNNGIFQEELASNKDINTPFDVTTSDAQHVWKCQDCGSSRVTRLMLTEMAES